MNNYYRQIQDFQTKLKEYAQNIFRVYGRELVLRLEEYNLLQNKHNCIESSTATGFVLEEFLVSKLEMYTHCFESDYAIDRFVGATASESFDCFSVKNGIKLMVNVKTEKVGSANNAVAAITQLHRNYCEEEPNSPKAFIILKVKYSVRDAYEDSEFRRAKPRHLYIEGLDSYCLEELDFSKGHTQDNRSWSENTAGKSTRNNGRLSISTAWRQEHRLAEDQISYENTYRMIDSMYNGNQ